MWNLCVFWAVAGRPRKGRFRPLPVPQRRFLGRKCVHCRTDRRTDGQTDRRTDLLRILIYFISFYICFIFVSWTCGHGYFGVFGIRLGITLSTLLVRAFATQCQFSSSEFQGSRGPFLFPSQAGGRPVDLLEELANVVQNNKKGAPKKMSLKTFDFWWTLAFSCGYLSYFSDFFWCYNFNIARLLDHEDQSSVKLPVGLYCGHILWTFVE